LSFFCARVKTGRSKRRPYEKKSNGNPNGGGENNGYFNYRSLAALGMTTLTRRSARSG